MSVLCRRLVVDTCMVYTCVVNPVYNIGYCSTAFIRWFWMMLRSLYLMYFNSINLVQKLPCRFMVCSRGVELSSQDWKHIISSYGTSKLISASWLVSLSLSCTPSLLSSLSLSLFHSYVCASRMYMCACVKSLTTK